jgi:hypothetical protein
MEDVGMLTGTKEFDECQLGGLVLCVEIMFMLPARVSVTSVCA